MLKIRPFLLLRASSFSALMKATVKKIVTVPGYTRRDGTFVPPHQKNVHYNPETKFADVASGLGSHSQKKAHAKLSAKEWWQSLSVDDKAVAVMSAATDMQEAASSSAAVSGWKKQALAGTNPKAAQWAAFDALPEQKKGALFDQVKAKVGSVAHLAADGKAAPVAPVAKPVDAAGRNAGDADAQNKPPAAAPVPAAEAHAGMSEEDAWIELHQMTGGSHYQKVAITKLKADAQWSKLPPTQKLKQAVSLYKDLQGAASHAAAVSMAKKAMLAGKAPSKAQHAAVLSASPDAVTKVMQAVGTEAFQVLMGQAAGATASVGVKPGAKNAAPQHQAATTVAPLASFAGADGIVAVVYKNPKGFAVLVKDADSGETVGTSLILPTLEWAESTAANIADGKPGPFEGDTKTGSDGVTLTLKNGHWVALQKDGMGVAPKRVIDSVAPADKPVAKKALTAHSKSAIDSMSLAELKAIDGWPGLPTEAAAYVKRRLAAAHKSGAAPLPAPKGAPAKPAPKNLTAEQIKLLKVDAKKVNAWFDPKTDGKSTKDTSFFEFVPKRLSDKFLHFAAFSKKAYYGESWQSWFKSQAICTLFGKTNKALTMDGVFISATEAHDPDMKFVTDAAAIKAAVMASWANDPVTWKPPAPVPAAAVDPIAQWPTFTAKHWGSISEMADIQPFLGTKDAGFAAIQAFAAGAFVEINGQPDSQEAQALTELVNQLPPTNLTSIHRALGFADQKSVDAFLASLGSDAAPGKQQRTFSSWTEQDPNAPGQTPMNNIALDLAASFGDHVVVLTLEGKSTAKDVSFVYAKDGKAKPGGELLLSAGAMLDVVSKATANNKTTVVVKEVHEGDTKQGVGGLLVLKDGHWVLANPGGSEAKPPNQSPAQAKPVKPGKPGKPGKPQKMTGAEAVASVPKPDMSDFKNPALINLALSQLLDDVQQHGVSALAGVTKNMKKAGKTIVNLPNPNQHGSIKVTGLGSKSTKSHTQLFTYLEALKAALNGTPAPVSTSDVRRKEPAPSDPKPNAMPGPAHSDSPNTGAPIIPATHSGSMDDWKQIGPQKGSNPGGKYIDGNGQEWYVKFPATESHVKNELLAGKLYEMLGVSGPNLMQVNQGGKIGIASRWVDGVKQVSAKTLKGLPGAVENFPIDAWLANWDAVGTGYDNMLQGPDGKAVRIDAGGALLYRAQGQAKGGDFASDVPELTDMMDASKNPYAADVFGGASPSSFAVALHKMALLKPSQIDTMIEMYGPTDKALRSELSSKLKSRRVAILEKYGVADPHNKPPVDETKIKVDSAQLPSALDFSNIGGKPLSSKPHVNDQNSKDSQALVKFASQGNLKALKDYHYDAVDKESGAALGKKPIIQHPAKLIKQQWGELVQTLQSIAHPTTESLSMPASGGILDAFFHPSDNVATIKPEFSMGFFMKLGESVAPPPVGSEPFFLTTHHPLIQKAKATYQGYSELTKKFIGSVQASGWVNHVWSLGAKGVVSQMGVPIQKLASEVYKNSTELPDGARLTRNMNDTSGETVKALLAAKPGTVFQNTDSMCSSFKEDWSAFGSEITMHITCAKGSRGTLSWGSGSHSSEKEITTLPGSRFYVTKITKGAHGGTSSKGVTVECIMLPPVDGYLALLENEVALGKSFNTGAVCKPHTKTLFLLRSPHPSAPRLLAIQTSPLPCFPNFAKRATH